jgi:hypothetical protein
MGKADCLSLIFINLYVPALTLHLNSIETSLRFSEKITFFAVCRIYTGVISKKTQIDTMCGGIIYIYTVQCGEQDGTLWLPIVYPLACTFHLRPRLNFRSDRKELISLIKFVEHFNLYNLYNKLGCVHSLANRLVYKASARAH